MPVGPVRPRPVVAPMPPLPPPGAMGTERFVQSARPPIVSPGRPVSFSGTIDGRRVTVDLRTPGTTFWKGNYSVWVNSVGANYDESRALAKSLRTAGWRGVADLIAKEPTSQNLFVDFSEAKFTRSKTDGQGTLLKTGEFVISGKLSPENDARIRYQPTPDGKGRVFVTVTKGPLKAPERELGEQERFALSERLMHGQQVVQAAPFISKRGYDAWKNNVPGGTEPVAGPERPSWGNTIGAWWQNWFNWNTR